MSRIEFVQNGASGIVRIDGRQFDLASQLILNAEAGSLPEVTLRCLLVHTGEPQTVLDIEAKVRYVVEFLTLMDRSLPSREFQVENVGLNEWRVRALNTPAGDPVPA